MSNKKPFIVLSKSTHKSRESQRRVSETSDNSDTSPASSRESSPSCILSSKIRAEGGFTDFSNSDIFVFPSKITSPGKRAEYTREFIAHLYSIKGDNKDIEVMEIIKKLGPVENPLKCNKIHLNEISQSRIVAQNVENVSADNLFRTPDPKHLAPSTPGPRVSKVPNIDTTHTPDDSLRIINHLSLSDDDARYIRGIGLVGLSSEYSVKKLRTELLGNNGKGWAKAEQFTVKKWFRYENKEIENTVDGEEPKHEVVIARIPKEEIITAVQHWASTLTERGQFVDLQSFDNCPEILHGVVVLVMGNDAGAGFSREGVRFCNREKANSGSKVFVTTLVQGSDKPLSLYQKQDLFSSLTGLRSLKTIRMGGKERKLLKFSVMDYEAAAEEFGTQVGILDFKFVICLKN